MRGPTYSKVALVSGTAPDSAIDGIAKKFGVGRWHLHFALEAKHRSSQQHKGWKPWLDTPAMRPAIGRAST